MSTPKRIDFTKTPPTSKRELTKENMLSYMKNNDKITKDEKQWFVNLMRDNTIEVTNNLTGKTTKSYKFDIIREAFAIKYFPDISKKGKKKTKPPIKTFDEELDDLIK